MCAPLCLFDTPGSTRNQEIFYGVTAFLPRGLVAVSIVIALLAISFVFVICTLETPFLFSAVFIIISASAGASALIFLSISLIRDVTAGIVIGIAEKSFRKGVRAFGQEVILTCGITFMSAVVAIVICLKANSG